jgi:rhamnulokinase
MTGGPHVAVDLGAASGRVMIGAAGPGRLELREVHRFPNDPVSLPDGLHWDVLRLYHEILEGLRRAGRVDRELQSIGIDSWGVDYGLLDDGGRLLGNPHHYRDSRTDAGVETVHALVAPPDLYVRNGLQYLPFNTVYQLAASRGTFELESAATMLLTPDLIGYWLTGVQRAEETMASTTGLLDARTRTWAIDLVEALGLPTAILPPLGRPGDVVGEMREAAVAETGLAPGVEVTMVGSHDTASAVVAVPAEGSDFAYISSGTWSLVGVELESPVLTEASRQAEFTNERGVDDRVRYLRNVMGLWLLQETLRAWDREGTAEDLGALLVAAGDLPSGGPRIEPNDGVFLPPGDMPARIIEACARTNQPPPASRPAMVRCILDSLAAAYARAIDDAHRLSGRGIRVVHVVGGGSQNALLCQLTADACGRPIVSGPVEATALGSILVQARAHGQLSGDLESLRALVRATQPLRRFEPAARGATTVG